MVYFLNILDVAILLEDLIVELLIIQPPLAILVLTGQMATRNDYDFPVSHLAGLDYVAKFRTIGYE